MLLPSGVCSSAGPQAAARESCPSAALNVAAQRLRAATLSSVCYCLQVEECQVKTTHPWEQCVFAHPTENARRRNPLTHMYIAEPCPDYKNGLCLLVRPPCREHMPSLHTSQQSASRSFLPALHMHAPQLLRWDSIHGTRLAQVTKGNQPLLLLNCC